MYNSTNPSELYLGTTWELLATDKYLRTTTGTPLQQGGSNSVAIAKANLPNIKIQVESFNLTGASYQAIKSFETLYSVSANYGEKVIPVDSWTSWGWCGQDGGGMFGLRMKKANYSSGATGSASPYTQALGSGTPLVINPAYITIRAWKRLS